MKLVRLATAAAALLLAACDAQAPQPQQSTEAGAQIAPILATPGQTTYPGYAGPYGGSLVPNAAVPGFLRSSRYGVATVCST